MNDENFLAIGLSAKLPPDAADIAVCVFEDEPAAEGVPDGELRELIAGLRRDGEFKGEAGTSLLLHTAGTNGARRLLVVGLGERADFDASAMSRATAAAVRRRASAGRIKQLNLFLPPAADARRLTRAASEGAALGLYDNSFYQKREDDARLQALNLISAEADGGQSDELIKEITRGQVVADAVNWARALADEPGGSRSPPEEFARRAAHMAAEFGLRVESLESGRNPRPRHGRGLWGGQARARIPARVDRGALRAGGRRGRRRRAVGLRRQGHVRSTRAASRSSTAWTCTR